MHHYINKKNEEADIVKIENGIPAIVSKDIFSLVQFKMVERKRQAQKNKKHDYALSGKLICGLCGSYYYGRSSKNNKGIETVRYICPKRYKGSECENININAEFLEHKIASAVRTWLKNLSFSDLDSVLNGVNMKSNYITVLEEELKQNQSKYKNIKNGIANGVYYVDINEDIMQCENKIELIKQQIELEKRRQLNAVYVKDEIVAILKKEIKHIDKRDDKEIILNYIKKVCIYQNSTCDFELVAHLNGSPINNDPIKMLENTIFAKLNHRKYKANCINSQEILTKQQKLWGIFTTRTEIDKKELCELRFVKHCSLEKSEVVNG